MIVKDPAGATVLTIGDTALVNGYLGTLYDEGERTFKRLTTESNWVDGVFEVASSLAGKTITVRVFIEAANWAAVSVKRAALLAAVEVPGWQLTVGSVTWVCDPADSASPIPATGTAADWREVTLTIPVGQQVGI